MNNKFLITILSANSTINHNKKNNNKAFSLIELSIVLIIMGLLVAGVTGGASLIQSAKIRATVNEYYEYRTAYNSYYARYEQVPGEDPNKPGLIQGYTGFKDLYEKDFIGREYVVATSNNNNGEVVLSKSGKFAWNLQNYSFSGLGKDCLNTNMLRLGHTWTLSESAGGSTAISLNYDEAYAIDDKIDDNSPTTGIARISVNGGQSITDDGKRNKEIYFKMDF